MGTFLTERIKNIKGWIPPEDIDGLDIFRAEYCRDAVNVDFENGFMRNTRRPVKLTYPQAVLDIIDDDWKVISSSFFRHTERGFTWFYMIRNAITGAYKFVVTDSTITDGIAVELMDGEVVLLAEASVPAEINYMIADNQLKINMNVSQADGPGTINTVGNLTLVYLKEERTYGSSPGVTKASGWYLVPRWLGFSYEDVITEVAEDSTHVTFDTSETDTTNSHGETFDVTQTSHDEDTFYAGGGAIRTNDFDADRYWEIVGLSVNAAQAIRFWWRYKFRQGGTPPNHALGLACTLLVKNSSDATLYSASLPFTGNEFGDSWQEITLDLSKYPTADKVGIFYPANGTYNTFSLQPHWDEFYVDYVSTTEWTLITVNDDQQRAVIQSGSGGLQVGNKIVIPVASIDWRVKEYEFYTTAPSGLLYRTLVLSPSDFTHVDDNMEYTLDNTAFDTTVSVDTLNFQYGLGAGIKPYQYDSDSNIKGDLIYSEVTFKGREYYVRDNNKVYMSHIAGNGIIQPDSFPYNADLEFGYIRSDYEFEILKTLSVTPLDELLVNAEQDNLVYTIQQGQTLIYRRIKSVNGEIGIGSRRSLLRSTKGTGIATGIFWTNPEGIYGYAGGIKEPIRINEVKLRHYWQSVINTETVISLFDPFKREILFANDKNIIVYDMVTSEWKPYKFDTGVLQFIGIKDTMAHFLGSDNNIYRIDQSSNVFFEGNFTTHDTTGYQIGKDGKPSPMSEMDDKIMQELYASITNPIGGSVVINIYADDNLIEGSIAMSTARTYQTCWSWLLIRYRRIRIKVYIAPTNIELREVGFTFSIPSQAPNSAAFGKEGGFGFNFGKVYGE